MPKTETRCHKDFCNALPIDPFKNTLLLDLDAALIRASYCDKDVSKCKHNSIADRMEI